MGFYRRHRHDHYDDHHGGMFTGVRLFHGPMRFRFFGRPVIVTTGKQVGFIASFIAILVMIISTFAIVGNLKTSSQDKKYYSTELEQLKTDAAPYLDIIDKAYNTSPEYNDYDVIRADYNKTVSSASLSQKITGYKISFDFSEWTVVYSFKVFETTYYGETVTSYISKSHVPDPLYIAYHITGYDENYDPTGVEFIDVEFKDTYESYVSYYESELETAKNSFKSALCGVIILGVIIAIIIAVIILLIVKVIKKSKQEAAFEKAKQEAEVKEAEARAQEAEAMAMQAEARLNLQRRYCEYCEAKFPDGESKCPNCGSTHFIIKK